jgi:hypothetical protein
LRPTVPRIGFLKAAAANHATTEEGEDGTIVSFTLASGHRQTSGATIGLSSRFRIDSLSTDPAYRVDSPRTGQ